VFVRPFDVLLLDEPEQRLDPGRIDRVVQAMRVRRDEGAAIVVATHSSDVATRTADRTVTLTARA
jgi:ABC-type multidrug transport system ATPase subunit